MRPRRSSALAIISARRSRRNSLPKALRFSPAAATAPSLRGGIGFAAFASAKFGLRAVAQAAARELGPKNIHVALLIIDSGVDTQWVRERIRANEGEDALAKLDPDRLMNPDAVAETYWQ